MYELQIPEELRRQARWVCLRRQGDRWEPFSHNGKPAYVLDPATWGTFEQAKAARTPFNVSHLGFALTADIPYAVVEVHGCYDEGAERPNEQARGIIGELRSYAERFHDGTGVRIFVKGKLPCGTSWAAAGKVVVYDRMAFARVSGNHLPDTPATLEDPGDRLRGLVRRLFPGVPPVAAETALTDEEVVAKATAAYGEKFTRLLTDDQFDGDGGLALARYFAFWTGRDPDRMRLLFEHHWPERGRRLSFLEPTFRKALQGLPSFKDVPVELVPADDPSVQKALALAEGLAGKGRPLWRAVFDLARHLVSLEGDPRRLRPAVDAFATRLGFDADECCGRFRQNWDKVRHPDGIFEQAVRLADAEPVEVSPDYSDRERRLAAIAYHLGQLAEGGVFFLAQPKLADVLGTSQRTVSGTITSLTRDGYLQVVDAKYRFGHGQANKAKTYRWRG